MMKELKQLEDNILKLLLNNYDKSGIKGTGRLRSSFTVKASYQGDYIVIDIGMLYYGLFVNFGVLPIPKSGKVYDIPDFLGLSKKNFSFNNRKYGLKGFNFIPNYFSLDKSLNIFDDIIQDKIDLIDKK